MKKHFKFTGKTKTEFGVTLCQIQATKDLPNGIKKGDIGGWIEKEENLSDNAWVLGNARLSGNAKIESQKDIISVSMYPHNVTVTPQNIVVGCKMRPRFGSKKDLFWIYLKQLKKIKLYIYHYLSY